LCVGDIIEVAIPLANLNGIVDLDSFSWEDQEIFKIEKNEKDALSYNRDI
jgi:hypothetical protein